MNIEQFKTIAVLGRGHFGKVRHTVIANGYIVILLGVVTIFFEARYFLKFCLTNV